MIAVRLGLSLVGLIIGFCGRPILGDFTFCLFLLVSAQGSMRALMATPNPGGDWEEQEVGEVIQVNGRMKCKNFCLGMSWYQNDTSAMIHGGAIAGHYFSGRREVVCCKNNPEPFLTSFLKKWYDKETESKIAITFKEGIKRFGCKF